MKQSELKTGGTYMVGRPTRGQILANAEPRLLISERLLTYTDTPYSPDGSVASHNRHVLGPPSGKPGRGSGTGFPGFSHTTGVPMLAIREGARREEWRAYLTNTMSPELRLASEPLATKALSMLALVVAPVIERAVRGEEIELKPVGQESYKAEGVSPYHSGMLIAATAQLTIVPPREVLATVSDYHDRVHREARERAALREREGVENQRAEYIGRSFRELGIIVFATPSGLRMDLDNADALLDRLGKSGNQ